MGFIKRLFGKYTVIINNPGDKKVNVIKTVRRATGWGLKESKEFVDFPPSKFLPMKKAEALQLKKDLENAGATVVIN